MAIAFDAQSYTASGSGTSATLSHTCTGTNLILIVDILAYRVAGTANSITGVTYNGVSMVSVGSPITVNATDEYQYKYYLIAPSTGTNNIIVSASNSLDTIQVSGVSYTGVKQSGQPDASVTDGPNASSSSETTTLTTIANNCWLVGAFKINQVGTWSAGANTVLRGTATNQLISLDTNSAQSPAGSKSITATSTATGRTSGYTISIAPLVTSNTNSFLEII